MVGEGKIQDGSSVVLGHWEERVRDVERLGREEEGSTWSDVVGVGSSLVVLVVGGKIQELGHVSVLDGPSMSVEEDMYGGTL